jgi:hypothetical protein
MRSTSPSRSGTFTTVKTSNLSSLGNDKFSSVYNWVPRNRMNAVEVINQSKAEEHMIRSQKSSVSKGKLAER